jgi:hypothetical protein
MLFRYFRTIYNHDCPDEEFHSIHLSIIFILSVSDELCTYVFAPICSVQSVCYVVHYDFHALCIVCMLLLCASLCCVNIDAVFKEMWSE